MKTIKIIYDQFKGTEIRKKAFPIIFILCVGLLFTGKTNAQDYNTLRRVEFGIRYMPTFSSLELQAYNDDIVKGSVTINHGFGIMLGFNLNKHIGLQAEVDYYQITQSFRDLDLSNKVNIKYLNIPLLITINTNKEKRISFNVVFGPQFGINAGATIKSTGTGNAENVRAVVAVKKGDVGFAYGAGLEFALNESHTVRLDVGYRGFYGLVDINSNKTDDNTYNVIAQASRKTNALYAGLTFVF
jgi:opacity protein-like surface antigen